MPLIELTSPDGELIEMNVEITSIRPAKGVDPRAKSIVREDAMDIAVRETVQEVVAKIKAAKGSCS
jgi:hypothetical protein